jgi:hypothetical protein
MKFSEYYNIDNLKSEESLMESISIDKDYIGLQIANKDAYIPLNHNANKILSSRSLGDCTGKWCFVHNNEVKSHWKSITKGGFVPIYIVTKNKKYIIIIDKRDNIEVFDSEDRPIVSVPGINNNDILASKEKIDQARETLLAA